jgi:hypothetical protein
MSKRLMAATMALGLLAARAWGQIPVGPEFQVNTFTTGHQRDASVAAAAGGAFAVAWESADQDGSGVGVFARFYDDAGTPLGGSEFRVNSFTTGHQYLAQATLQGGKLVVVWVSIDQDGSGPGIFARQFDAASGVGGSEFRVNTYTTGHQHRPSVAADSAGNFIVVWEGYRDGSYTEIFGQRYDVSGTPQGGEFRVNTYTTGDQSHPVVATDPSGRFLVVWWSDQGQGAPEAEIFGQAYDPGGVPVGSEFRVNTTTTGFQSYPSVAAGGNGNFVVVWASYPNGYVAQAFGRRFDAAGTPQGGEFEVSAYTTSIYLLPTVSADPSGRFVVAWTSLSLGVSSYDAFARRFDRLGAPAGPAFRLNASTTAQQRDPSVALDASADLIAVWSSPWPLDGNLTGVFGQRFTTPLFADDFESGTLAAWSATATDGGDLGASVLAGMKSTGVGLRGLVDDTAGLYVQDDSPDHERRYRARFYLDPNGFDPGEALAHRRTRTFIAFSEAPTRRVAAIVLRRLGGVYSLMGRARLDDNSQADTGFFTIADGPHAVEIDLVSAGAPDALNGSFELWIDGVSRIKLTGLDNSLAAVDFVRMGALSVKAGANGALFWDEFESHRKSPIGP